MLDGKQKSSYLVGMNKLDIKTRVTILNLLVEGSSMRSISRVTGVSKELHDMEWLAGIIEAAAPKQGRRGPYRKKDNSN